MPAVGLTCAGCPSPAQDLRSAPLAVAATKRALLFDVVPPMRDASIPIRGGAPAQQDPR